LAVSIRIGATLPARAQRLADFQAVEPRHHQVEHQQVAGGWAICCASAELPSATAVT
jgi:hypothetical protein